MSKQNWRPPEGLGYSPGRPVRLTGQGKFLAWVVATMVVGGFVLGIYVARKGKHDAQQRRLLDQQGVAAEATVTRLWRTGDEEHAPRVSYRYEYQGSIYVGSVGAPLARWRALKVGQRLTVRFLPSRPRVSHPVDWDWRGQPWWVPYLITGMFAGIGAFLALHVASQMRLLAEGRPAPGTVTAIRRDKGTIVRYEFELMNGTKVKGRSMASKATLAGDTVCVLYDPERPGRNTLYPMQMVRLDR